MAVKARVRTGLVLIAFELFKKKSHECKILLLRIFRKGHLMMESRTFMENKNPFRLSSLYCDLSVIREYYSPEQSSSHYSEEERGTDISDTDVGKPKRRKR